ncbi:probable Xaa-Pro aminopeptidase P isoform X2 [Cotesia glomerata]|uniref:probable Xaa-Pro aminopeptidase P isoform X2 n=1 Tax=Cotesia glomerata TaxID=32391 RepID=UPI001D002A02|nr:probable Xaa-Pro aminopeptidase P isoform X2 [Cotesia glomerata]
MRSSHWIILFTFLPGLMSDHDEYSISQPPLDYNGSKRTGCPKSAFDSQPAGRYDSSITLRQLRSEMVRMTSVQDKPLDGYIVTSNDDHQSESVSPHDMRREFLTGFYGSAGEALVTLNKAVLWADGRYHLQADQQLDCNWILMKYGHKGVPSITEWLRNEFSNRTDVRIGADPMLIPAFVWETWEKELAQSSVNLIAVSTNLIDLIWQIGRPKNNTYAAYPLEIKFAGKAWQEKVRQIRLKMELFGADALVITALDEIAWLLNIRGWDLPNTPVLKSYVIVTQGSIYLYAERHKVLRSVGIHLKSDGCYHADCVRLKSYTDIWNDLRTMSQTWSKVWLPSYCGYAQGASRIIYISIPVEKRFPHPSPIIELRAVKNEIEILGMRKAHLRDAVAMCDFMAYMEEQLKYKTTKWDEMQVARVVNEFRLEMDYNQGISFPTIVGYGPHAALPHYEPIDSTSLMIELNSTLVIDSGGQYLDGTTDVTRTIHFAPISVSYNMNATPTAGCTCYLSPGNFLSNEPGYYKAGDFGIRLENILEVVEADTPQQDKQRFLKFRDVTLIPYEPKLIDTSMLSSAHRRWLNNYNSRIRNEVGPELKKHLRMVGFKWMMKKTRSIPESGDVDERLFVGAASPSYFKYSGALITIVILIQIWADELLIL